MMDTARLQSLKQFNAVAMDYAAWPVQQAVHDSTAAVILISGGEGSGKSRVTASEIALRYGTWRRVLLVGYKATSPSNEADELYADLKRIDAVAEYRKPRGGDVELTTRDGAIVESITTYSEGERAVSGTGKSYDIIAMLEAGKQTYAVFQACLLRASRTGGLLILSGTIEKSEPWFPDLITRLQGPNELGAEVFPMPTWENRTLYPGGRDDPKILKLEGELGEDLFLERCAGKPAPLHSLVFKEFGFLTHVFDWCLYDPNQTVEAWVDGALTRSVNVPVRVSQRVEVLVAARPVARHVLLGAEDVRTERREMVSGQDPLRDLGAIIGRRAIRGISPGEPMLAGMVELPPLVRRGEIVLVIAEGQGLRATALGEAREEGKAGDVVRVRNLSSGREVYGQVEAERTIRVPF